MRDTHRVPLLVLAVNVDYAVIHLQSRLLLSAFMLALYAKMTR